MAQPGPGTRIHQRFSFPDALVRRGQLQADFSTYLLPGKCASECTPVLCCLTIQVETKYSCDNSINRKHVRLCQLKSFRPAAGPGGTSCSPPLLRLAIKLSPSGNARGFGRTR